MRNLVESVRDMKEAELDEAKADFAIVAIKNGKVVDQMHSIAKSEFKDVIKVFKKNNPGAKISIENKSGKIVHTEGLDEAKIKVSIEGLPDIYLDGNSPSAIKAQLRKVIKNPDMITSVERVPVKDYKQAMRDRVSGKDNKEPEEVEENKKTKGTKMRNLVESVRNILDEVKKASKGTKWEYEDSTGVKRIGILDKFSDKGGTDITYFFKRVKDGRLDVVSGSRLKNAKVIK